MSSETKPTMEEGSFSERSASAETRWRKGLRRFSEGFSAALGVGGKKRFAPESPPPQSSTELAHERTELALQRTYWAADRTLMGWIRTALALISFGFTIGKLGAALEGVETNIRAGELSTLGFFLLGLGLTSLVAAAAQYGVRVKALSEHGLPLQFSLTFAVALALILIGIVALTALVLR